MQSQKVLRLIGLCLIVVMGACATTHTVETTGGEHVQVREVGGFLEQPVTVGGYLAVLGISLGLT